MPDIASRSKDIAASVGGSALAGAVRLVAAARPAAKPLHPRGEVVQARLRRFGTAPATGSVWLDEAGEDEVLVRRSRAVGLPAALPDFHGLAIRVPLAGGGHGDLLLATTGRGRVTRFLLSPGWSAYTRPLTTLLPYRTPRGPVLVAATARDEQSYDLSHASAQGEWHRFGELVLSSETGQDPLISFDPLLNTLPGLDNYEWVRRLREPGYWTARHSR